MVIEKGKVRKSKRAQHSNQMVVERVRHLLARCSLVLFSTIGAKFCNRITLVSDRGIRFCNQNSLVLDCMEIENFWQLSVRQSKGTVIDETGFREYGC